MLNGCSSKNALAPYEGQQPAMNIASFFDGPIKAWGLVQNRKGVVVTRFDVDMVGRWDGDTGVLEEEFRYYDGTVQNRVWTLTKSGESEIIGTAGDIIGQALGEQRGNAFRFAYTMDIPVDGTTYRVKLDDWMWMMNDGVLINRSYIKKFGFTVAELTVFMQKQ